MGESLRRWMKPKDAVVALSPLMGGDKAAKTQLAERLRDRMLQASAMYHTQAFDIGPVPIVFTGQASEISAAIGEKIVPIDRGFPTVSKTSIGSRYVYAEHGRDLKRRIHLGNVAGFSHDWERDFKRWDWAAGTFVFSRRPAMSGPGAAKQEAQLRFPTRFVFYGVEFDKDEIEEMVRAFGGSPIAKRANSALADDAFSELHEPVHIDRSKGGKPRDAASWTNFWNEVCKILKDGRLKKDQFQSQNELRAELIEVMGSGHLSESSIKPWVRRIWHTYIEPRQL